MSETPRSKVTGQKSKGIPAPPAPDAFSLSEEIRHAFHHDLAKWYEKQQRDLPWRRTRDPYAIAVSEFMLQQTQVVTVLPYYARWLREFPDWPALAEATPERVLKRWEGLGYYQRARNLQKLAQAVVARADGALPREVAALRELPGIGPYTAGALASLAFGQRAALLDGNVMRVLTRVFDWREDIARPAAQKKLWALAEALLPGAAACAVHNSALMELGALVCTPGRPACLLCPLQKVCRTRDPENLPVKRRGAAEAREEEIALIERDRRWWCERGPTRGRLADFWKFPDFDGKRMEAGRVLLEFTYGITKYRVRLRARQARWKQAESGAGAWFDLAEMRAVSMAAAHRKVRETVLSGKTRSANKGLGFSPEVV